MLGRLGNCLGQALHQTSKHFVRKSSTLSQTCHADVDCLINDCLNDFPVYLKTIVNENELLKNVSLHSFQGKGKLFRPRLVALLSVCCNQLQDGPSLKKKQLKLAYISEVIHTASLIHDDIVDDSDVRRSYPSVGALFGSSSAVYAGNFLMGKASLEVAALENNAVTKLLSQVTEDLVTGELMQLGVKKSSEQRFGHYIEKSYRKTASLMAHSCKATSILSDPQALELHDACYQIGRNIGLAFQLADDLLDFTLQPMASDKPTNADLVAGLATAPILFAALQHSDLNAMIVRGFSGEKDIKLARELTLKSTGIQDTECLITNHLDASAKLIHNFLPYGTARNSLMKLQDSILTRINNSKSS